MNAFKKIVFTLSMITLAVFGAEKDGDGDDANCVDSKSFFCGVPYNINNLGCGRVECLEFGPLSYSIKEQLNYLKGYEDRHGKQECERLVMEWITDVPSELVSSLDELLKKWKEGQSVDN
jgi:hypothetical protein